MIPLARNSRHFLLLFAVSASWTTTASAQESLEVVGDLGGMVNDYLSERAVEFLDRRERAMAQLDSRAKIEERQEYVRARFLESFGGFPEKTPLNPVITRTLERSDYRVEMLRFESLPGFYVTANVYVPQGPGAPFPAVVGVAGHSANGKASATYQHAWISMVKRGFVVLAFDPPGQGERSLYFDPELGRSRVGIGVPEHNLAGLQALLTGSHFARYEIWDGIRAVDYLHTRDDVDPQRIAVAGNSGGGTQAAYLAVVEPRLAAAISSCYMTSWRQLWFAPGPQDGEQDFVHFLTWGLDFSDFAIAAAPRPYQILSATRDYFPIAGARSSYEEARRIYEILGKKDRLGFFEIDDTHGWSKPRREASYRWLMRWLQDREEEGLEGEIETELESVLYVTPTGQVATSHLGAETVQSLNWIRAEEIYPDRKASGLEDRDALRDLVRSRLMMSTTDRASPELDSRGELGREGYRIEKLTLVTEPGITVPALVYRSSRGPARRPAILYVHGGGKAADAAPGRDIEELVRSGYLVLVPDPRGIGESRPTAGLGGHQPIWQTLQRSLLVSKTLVGMQVEDLLRAFDYLRSREDVDPRRISILGKGDGGLLGLFVALLEPRVEALAIEGTVLSYRDVVRSRLHENLTAVIVPGILQDFDLPDLAAAFAPRRLWVVDPRSPTGSLVSIERAREEYALASKAYEKARAAGRFRILHRPEGWSVSKLYASWLASAGRGAGDPEQ